MALALMVDYAKDVPVPIFLLYLGKDFEKIREKYKITCIRHQESNPTVISFLFFFIFFKFFVRVERGY